MKIKQEIINDNIHGTESQWQEYQNDKGRSCVKLSIHIKNRSTYSQKQQSQWTSKGVHP